MRNWVYRILMVMMVFVTVVDVVRYHDIVETSLYVRLVIQDMILLLTVSILSDRIKLKITRAKGRY